MLQIQINTGKESMTLKAPFGKQLKWIISDAKIPFSFPCAGLGRCGKCRVRFIKGVPGANNLDRTFLTETEIQAGVRLLCRCVLTDDAVIDLEYDKGPDGYNNIEETIAAETMDVYTGEAVYEEGKKAVSKWGLAVDIGTTTIAVSLVGLAEKDAAKLGTEAATRDPIVIDTISGINHQRQFGADVISRIQAASEKEGAKFLKRIIQEDIAALCGEILGENHVKKAEAVVVTGNTTMLHLLRGVDVTGLGQYPYITGNLSLEKISGNDLFDSLETSRVHKGLLEAEVMVMPGISAFVGADIVAGIYELGMLRRDSNTLLLDLGTNGEMAFWNGKRLSVTSTAAGPVFEGCGISCGIPSVKGAISHVTIEGISTENALQDEESRRSWEIEYETIGDEKPVGLCGTGVMETVSELVRNKIVDETGLLTEDYFEEGFVIAGDDKKIVITQGDIRNVQLAKAAIFVGQQELIKDEAVKEIIISGGFGSHIDPEKIKRLRLFCNEEASVIAAGNTALKGCVRFLSKVMEGGIELQKAITELVEICDTAEVVSLAGSNDFGENYVAGMNF